MMELYAIRRDAGRSDIVRELIRHGVLIPIVVTVEAADGDTSGTRVRYQDQLEPGDLGAPVDETPPEDVESEVPDVVWGGDQT